MAYGAQIWSDNGKQWVDVVQPTWILDMKNSLSGKGSLTYPCETGRFKIYALVINYFTVKHQENPSFTYAIKDANNMVINYNLPDACTFLVVMETR
ncbi:hypothetical protein ACJVQT_23210 [Enterobacter huaxiensis]|uniref:hypothetical protein n=1 Tax=Enterobacter huaxiensis TaxID=2494702 RepID=UPI0021757FE4|nr:hypothetical protein [Enterobacter huaxiensis]MCS5452488.1 hypothetical protein [Enterobacter huaxiensis]